MEIFPVGVFVPSNFKYLASAVTKDIPPEDTMSPQAVPLYTLSVLAVVL